MPMDAHITAMRGLHKTYSYSLTLKEPAPHLQSGPGAPGADMTELF